MKLDKKTKFKSGFTIIEALTVLFVFSVITLTFYSIFTLGINYALESKSRLGAVSLANEKMEIIRNLAYDNIGIVGGIPSGSLPAEEDVFASKKTYHVKTFVQYIDDPFDGISPIDLDYKRAKVTVSWLGPKNKTSTVTLVARFVPPGMEQAVSGGGTLSVNVMDSQGIGVPQSSVHVTNTEVSPSVDVTAMTDNTGNLMLPGAKHSIGSYYLTVSKEGYEEVVTIDPLAVSYTVTDTPASVVEDMMNVKSIIQDKLADLKIVSTDSLGAALPGVNFHVEGGRILGYDMLQSPAAPEYKMNIDSTTEEDGEKEFNEISPGSIYIAPIGTPLGYVLVNVDYFTEYDVANNEFSFILSPDTEKTVHLKYAKEDAVAFFGTIKKNSDNTLLENANVTLSNSEGYNETITTKKDGKVFFPSGTVPLVSGVYNLTITADGFGAYAENDIAIDQLIAREIKLTET